MDHIKFECVHTSFNNLNALSVN